MKQSPIIWLEGPIAAGKSTAARRIGELLDFHVIEEPVDSNPYLELFYRDPAKWAFSMQIFLLHYRYAMKQEAAFAAVNGRRKGVILDRSIAGDRVFAKLHKEAGNIHTLDWETYEFAYNVMACSIQPPTLFLYLDCQPETCQRRMRERNRTAEAEVPLAYLKELREGYEELLRQLRRGLSPWNHAIQVERIMWDKDTASEVEWQALARTIEDACNRTL
jgi:NADH dehydrogenase (ubiquinone) 1 alpha subcomplex subunit 10